MVYKQLQFTSIILGFIIFFLGPGLTAQPASNAQDHELGAAEIVRLLEQKHNVRIFFDEKWFGSKTYSRRLLDEPLPAALEQLARPANLKVVTLKGLFFLVPSEDSHIAVTEISDRLIVGNPNEFGRYSRVTVTGRVTDGSTGEPLFGAVIFEPESGRGASTNLQGVFSIELPAGDVRIRVSYIGYEERLQSLRIFSPGSIELELFSGSTQLDEFTLMARRAGENLESTRMGFVHLDTRAIRELPVNFGERDIVRSVSLMPGVQTVGEFGTGFNVRGGSADQNLILLENVPLFNSSHLFGLISVINPDLVNNVTLIKAGTPARYGERASSVMDIRLGHNTDELSVLGGIGVLNTRILVEAPIIKEKAAFSLGARSLFTDRFLGKMPNRELMNSSAGFNDITGLVTLTLDAKNRFTLFGYRSFDKFSFGGETRYQYTNTLASLRWNSIISANLTSVFVMGLSNYDHQILDVPDKKDYQHFRLNSDIRYKSLKWYLTYLHGQSHKFDIGLNAIHYGIDPGRLNPYGNDSSIKPETIDPEKGLEVGAFLSDEISFGESVSAELGIRYSHFMQLGPARVYQYMEGQPKTPGNITDSIFFGHNKVVSHYGGLEPRASMRIKTSESSSVKLSFTRINQYINLISNTSVMAPTDVWKLSDTHIRPLVSDQYSAGYFRNFRNNSIETSVEAYYKDLYNVVEYKSGAEIAMNPYLETDVINARGYNYGIELYLKKNYGRLTGWTSYTYSVSMRRSDSPFPESQINRNTWFPSNYDRPHNLVINGNYHISRRWRLGATFTYNTGRPVTLPELTYWQGSNMLVYFSDRNKYRLPDYHRLDISISQGENLRTDQRGKGSWSFSLMNVYARKNPYSVFYKKETGTQVSDTSFKLYQLYIIGRMLPTFSYNFRF